MESAKNDVTSESFKNLVAIEETKQTREVEWMKTDAYLLFKYGAIPPKGEHCYLVPKGWDRV